MLDLEGEALGVGEAGRVAAAVAEGEPEGEAPAGVGDAEAAGVALPLPPSPPPPLRLSAAVDEGETQRVAPPELLPRGEALSPTREGEGGGEAEGEGEPQAEPEAAAVLLPARRVAVEPGLPVSLRVGSGGVAVAQGEGGAVEEAQTLGAGVLLAAAEALPRGLGGAVCVPLPQPVAVAQPEGLGVPRGALCEAPLVTLGRKEALAEAVEEVESEALAVAEEEASAPLREGEGLPHAVIWPLREGEGAPLSDCAPPLPLGLAEPHAEAQPLSEPVVAALALSLQLSTALAVRGSQRVAVEEVECEGGRVVEAAVVGELVAPTPPPPLQEGGGVREAGALMVCAPLPVTLPQAEPLLLGVPA